MRMYSMFFLCNSMFIIAPLLEPTSPKLVAATYATNMFRDITTEEEVMPIILENIIEDVDKLMFTTRYTIPDESKSDTVDVMAAPGLDIPQSSSDVSVKQRAFAWRFRKMKDMCSSLGFMSPFMWCCSAEVDTLKISDDLKSMSYLRLIPAYSSFLSKWKEYSNSGYWLDIQLSFHHSHGCYCVRLHQKDQEMRDLNITFAIDEKRPCILINGDIKCVPQHMQFVALMLLCEHIVFINQLSENLVTPLDYPLTPVMSNNFIHWGEKYFIISLTVLHSVLQDYKCDIKKKEQIQKALNKCMDEFALCYFEMYAVSFKYQDDTLRKRLIHLNVVEYQQQILKWMNDDRIQFDTVRLVDTYNQCQFLRTKSTAGTSSVVMWGGSSIKDWGIQSGFATYLQYWAQSIDLSLAKNTLDDYQNQSWADVEVIGKILLPFITKMFSPSTSFKHAIHGKIDEASCTFLEAILCTIIELTCSYIEKPDMPENIDAKKDELLSLLQYFENICRELKIDKIDSDCEGIELMHIYLKQLSMHIHAFSQWLIDQLVNELYFNNTVLAQLLINIASEQSLSFTKQMKIYDMSDEELEDRKTLLASIASTCNTLMQKDVSEFSKELEKIVNSEGKFGLMFAQQYYKAYAMVENLIHNANVLLNITDIVYDRSVQLDEQDSVFYSTLISRFNQIKRKVT